MPSLGPDWTEISGADKLGRLAMAAAAWLVVLYPVFRLVFG